MIKREKVCVGLGILLLSWCLNGCSQNVADKEIDAEIQISKSIEQTNTFQHTSNNQTLSLSEVMNRIIAKQGLNNVLDYESKIEDISKDMIILLCQSECGKYTAYGFISPEYGKKGILIDNIIDGQSNWNYFEENWYYEDTRPTLEEVGEYEVIFTFMQDNNGTDNIRKIWFDSFDTGTMSMRE